MLSTFSIGWSISQRMTRGKAGQISSVFLAGVLAEHTSCRSRRRGDPKTTIRHRRHTCTSVCHASNSAQKTNIASRTSSGSKSTRPTLYRVSQLWLDKVTQRTYVDVGWLISCQSSDVHDLSTSGNSLRSVTQGGWEVMQRTRAGRCWSTGGKLDDGSAFERGHLG